MGGGQGSGWGGVRMDVNEELIFFSENSKNNFFFLGGGGGWSSWVGCERRIELKFL